MTLYEAEMKDWFAPETDDYMANPFEKGLQDTDLRSFLDGQIGPGCKVRTLKASKRRGQLACHRAPSIKKLIGNDADGDLDPQI